MRKLVAAFGALGLIFATVGPVAAVGTECSTIGGNLLSNCDFETGTTEGWTRGGDGSSSYVLSGVHHGASGYSYYANPADYAGTMSQQFSTVVGHAYAVRFWMQTGSSDSSWEIEVFENGNETSVAGQGGSGTGSAWEVLVQNNQLAWIATTTQATIVFEFWGGTTGTYIDDVTVKEVPLAAATTATKAKGMVTLTLSATAGPTEYQCQWARHPYSTCISDTIKSSAKYIDVIGTNDGGLTWGPYSRIYVTRL